MYIYVYINFFLADILPCHILIGILHLTCFSLSQSHVIYVSIFICLSIPLSCSSVSNYMFIVMYVCNLGIS